jgi:ABC-type polysaccharide/polyol phosphate export permease
MPLYIVGCDLPSTGSRQASWRRWNPMLHLVDLARNAFEPRHMPHAGLGWNFPASVALIVLALALALYWRDRQKFLMDR